MSFWKRQEFKALQEAWYQRLAAEGFEDAEEFAGHDLVLKQSAAHPLRHEASPCSREEYYYLIAQKVESAPFRTDVDRLIMTRRAAGARIKTICEELSAQGEARCRYTVRIRIRIYEREWGLREWTPKQLNRKTG